MDYETFGEHNWKETGIFEFIKALPKEIQLRNMQLSTIKNAVKENESRGAISVPNTISWADTERDLSAWLGNELQQDAFEIMKSAKNNKNVKLWRMLQTSDHFYYMSTKHFSDQEVHEYFNPYHSPYLAFIYYSNIFEDFLKTFS
jgi:alpha-amylase